MAERFTPLDDDDTGDHLVQEIVEDYQSDMPPMRPQARQPSGPMEMQYEEPIKRVRRVVTNKEEDLKSYILKNGKEPLVAGILFFLLNQQFVDEQLIKYIPKLFNLHGEISMFGLLFKAALLSVLLLLVKRFIL